MDVQNEASAGTVVALGASITEQQQFYFRGKYAFDQPVGEAARPIFDSRDHLRPNNAVMRAKSQT